MKVRVLTFTGTVAEFRRWLSDGLMRDALLMSGADGPVVGDLVRRPQTSQGRASNDVEDRS